MKEKEGMKMKSVRSYGHVAYSLVFSMLFLFPVTPISAKMVTYVKEYRYQASEGDSKLSCRTVAFELVKRLLLEELGTYLMSETEVKDFDLTKDRISSLTAGIVSTVILEEKWDGQTYFLKAKISTDTDELIKLIDRIRGNQEQSKNWEEIMKKTEEALSEIEKLKKEIRKGSAEKVGQEKYVKANNELSAIYWFKKGLELRYNDKNNQEALKAFDKAIEIDPNYGRAYAFRAAIYNDWSQYPKALRESEQAIKLDPNFFVSFTGRGVAHTGMGNYREGIRDFNKAIELEPKNAPAYANRSWAYYELKTYHQGLEDAQKAIELDPNLYYSYYHRGRSLAALGNYQGAVEDYNQTIRLNPIFSWSFFFRGIAFMKLGKEDQALEDFKKAASLGNREAQSSLKKKGIQW